MTRTLSIETERLPESRVNRIHRGDSPQSSVSSGHDRASIFRAVYRASILVVFVIVTFPPWFSWMNFLLDGSWSIGLNEVSSRHMTFGRDTIFTYGPLGFVMTPHEIGSNLVHSILIRLGLHILWWTSVGMLLFRVRGFVAVALFALASVLSGIHFGPGWDVNLQLGGVIILTTVGYLVLGEIDRRPMWAIPAALVAAAAMLSKFNIGMACTGSLVVWSLIQLWRDRSPRMLGRLGLVALAYVGSLAGFFRLYGGPIDALGEFLKYSGQIASGYSSQMSAAGPVRETAVAWAVLAIAVFAAQAGFLLRARFAPVLLIILFPLFVLFKGAIVRYSPGHMFGSCPATVGLVAFLLPGRIGRWHSWSAQATAALSLVAASWIAPTSVAELFTRGPLAMAALWNYDQTRAQLRAHESTLKNGITLPKTILSRIGSATMDVYPWDIATAVENGLNWKPRFVFQSYAAYTRDLDLKCAENFQGENAPRFIIYSHLAIDTQHPCIVDARTWLEIYRWYDVADQMKDALLLERRSSPRWDKVAWLATRSITLGGRCEIPSGAPGAVILQAKLKLSPLGRLINMAYKVYPPTIRVEYKDGTVADHRLVWQNTESGFLVSSLPRTLSDFRRLLEKGEANPVAAVSFRDDDGCFENKFEVTWYRAPLTDGSGH